ncbi:enterochelin esterase [Corynebacterium renale]|uniref:alpha/beta hydrolase-fold protein n=1 Tax=Corynebacterium renale TaxID=1724 RepID=UPI000DA2BE53|nr:alpha/beta hydrolase-fold protein [Corynebacterium renale]SQG64232.1 enterochelin esterase [Corynebacterium renale]STC94672.1 enterochelin esterase [Corynebacterium renale]
MFFTDAQLCAAPDCASEMWSRAREQGLPLYDPATMRATFLWESDTAPEAVHVFINRVTDKARFNDGFMHHVPGTRLWARTLELPPTLKVSYGFAEFAAREEAVPKPPKNDVYHRFYDPHSALPPLIDSGSGTGLSTFYGQLAGDSPWHHVVDFPDVAIETDTVANHQVQAYVPESARVALLLFDGETWFPRLHLPEVFAQLGLPVAIFTVFNKDMADRRHSLGANAEFLSAMLEWVHSRAAGLPVWVAGQSLGGLSTLTAVAECGEQVSAALAQSPSMWWVPGGKASPADLSAPGMPWLSRRYAEIPAGGCRVTLQVGDHEDLSIPRVAQLHGVMKARGWDTTFSVPAGGHDWTWWRDELVAWVRGELIALEG